MAEARSLLADRYRLVRQVGSGGMGIVWEAWDERLERPVAVKVLKPQLGLSPEEAELAKNRAMREARITARLHHRNAVPVFDVVEHEGQPCLVMQYLASVPLSVMLREGGPLGVHEAATIGAQVASALAAAHQLGIVHRDVKPGNILMADDGTALISDFGISHALGDATLTSTGLVHGTPAYLAPEVARGADSTYASDVFSLGATLYASLEGGPPFGSDPNSIALLYRVASGELDPPQRAGRLTPVLMEMLRPDPAARPSMREAAAQLAAIEAGDDVTPATAPLPATVPSPVPVPVPEPAPVPEKAPVATGTTRLRPGLDRPVAVDEPAAPPAGRRRPGAGVWAVVALLVGLAVVGTVLVVQLGRSQPGGAAGTATARTSTSTRAPSASKTASRSATATATKTAATTASASDPSSAAEPTASPTASSTSSPSSSSSSGTPTAAELEDAITGYYALVPANTDEGWLRLTADYQTRTSGGRKSYQQFWDAIDRVSVSKVQATPPSRVEATITYRRSGQVSVERTAFRLVRDDGVLKIADSTVLGRG